jgi:hypothetical protein
MIIGQAVSHPKYGKGVVKELSFSAVTVLFATGGEYKKILSTFVTAIEHDADTLPLVGKPSTAKAADALLKREKLRKMRATKRSAYRPRTLQGDDKRHDNRSAPCKVDYTTFCELPGWEKFADRMQACGGFVRITSPARTVFKLDEDLVMVGRKLPVDFQPIESSEDSQQRYAPQFILTIPAAVISYLPEGLKLATINEKHVNKYCHWPVYVTPTKGGTDYTSTNRPLCLALLNRIGLGEPGSAPNIELRGKHAKGGCTDQPTFEAALATA